MGRLGPSTNTPEVLQLLSPWRVWEGIISRRLSAIGNRTWVFVQPCSLKYRLAIIHQLHQGMLTPSVSCRGFPEPGPRSNLDLNTKETPNLSCRYLIFFSLLSSSRAFLKLTEKQLCVHTSSLESVLFFWVLMLHSFVLHTISTRTFCPPGFISQSIISTPPPSGCITLARMLN